MRPGRLDGIANASSRRDADDKDVLYDLPHRRAGPGSPGARLPRASRARSRRTATSLLVGGVFTDYLLETWVHYKRTHE